MNAGVKRNATVNRISDGCRLVRKEPGEGGRVNSLKDSHSHSHSHCHLALAQEAQDAVQQREVEMERGPPLKERRREMLCWIETQEEESETPVRRLLGGGT